MGGWGSQRDDVTTAVAGTTMKQLNDTFTPVHFSVLFITCLSYKICFIVCLIKVYSVQKL